MINPPHARTTAGAVEGELVDGVAVFRRISFAAPPVGANRFTEPRPAQHWDGVRDSTVFGSAPPGREGVVSDDDWLTLAVWTPEPGAGGLPVIVWFSGGAYLQCTTANPHHDGTVLASQGVVVVSVNYRVGAEGWAHIPGFPDNRGLLDQIAALRWVEENIAVFGGDPDNVTIFGQSSGAGSVAALTVMPRAAGLFDRAILQSIPGTYLTPELAALVTECICAEFDPALDPAQLTLISPQRLSEVVMTVSEHVLPSMAAQWGPIAYTPTPFSPIVDGEILPTTPWDGVAAGSATHVPMLFGHTRDDGRLLAARLGPDTDGAVAQMIDNLAPGVNHHDYRKQFPELSRSQLRELALGDWLLRMPTLRLAEAAYASGSPVWLSELCWGYGPQGASHTLDALLVFGTADVFGEVTHAGTTAAEQYEALSGLMRREYLAFAQTGDPGWAPYIPSGRATTRIYAEDSSVQPYPEHRSAAIWRDHRFAALELPPAG